MAVFLNEQQFGYAADYVAFPNLLICMGLVCMANNTLYGVHFDAPSDTAVVSAGFANWLTGLGVQQNQIVALYGASNWNERYRGAANKKASWKAEMTSIAQAIGYQDKIRGFDTSILVTDAPAGTQSVRFNRAKNIASYVAYYPDFGKSKCKIFYKKSWKMDYTDTTTKGYNRNDVVQFNANNNAIRTGNFWFKDTNAAVLSANSNASDLHELNYALRLISFN